MKFYAMCISLVTSKMRCVALNLWCSYQCAIFKRIMLIFLFWLLFSNVIICLLLIPYLLMLFWEWRDQWAHSKAKSNKCCLFTLYIHWYMITNFDGLICIRYSKKSNSKILNLYDSKQVVFKLGEESAAYYAKWL